MTYLVFECRSQSQKQVADETGRWRQHGCAGKAWLSCQRKSALNSDGRNRSWAKLDRNPSFRIAASNSCLKAKMHRSPKNNDQPWGAPRIHFHSDYRLHASWQSLFKPPIPGPCEQFPDHMHLPYESVSVRAKTLSPSPWHCTVEGLRATRSQHCHETATAVFHEKGSSFVTSESSRSQPTGQVGFSRFREEKQTDCRQTRL